MKALIIEDEHAAAQALRGLLAEVAPDVEVLAILQSIEEGMEWFGAHAMPDLALVDIHIADGSSFTLFERVKITCPVIFTTAYDQYALKAFEVNSIDYLLKPVSEATLRRAIDKLRSLPRGEGSHRLNASAIEKLLKAVERSRFKSTLLVASRDKLTPLPVRNIAYVYTENKIVRAVDFSSREYVLDMTIEAVASSLDPQLFFRANRQYVISRDAVKDISVWFNGRLAVNLSVKTPEKVFVSRTNARGFKDWLAG